MACPLPPTLRVLEKGITQSSIPLLSETEAEWQKKSQEYNKRLQDEMENRSKQKGSFLEREGSPFDTVGANESPDGRMNTPTPTDVPTEEQRVVSYFLFRYLDYSVTPGKTYRYRVKLWLANPNYGLNESDVANFDLTKEKYLTTDVSNASNKVTIPPDSRVLARTVSSPSRSAPWSEPTANVLAVYFDMTDGSEWVWGESEQVSRGSTLNIKSAVTKDPATLGKPKTPNLRTPTAGTTVRPTPTSTNPNDPKAQPQRRDVITNTCIMDIYGGIELGKVVNDAPSIRTPGKILVINSVGEIAIHNLIEDNEEIDLMSSPQTDINRNNPNYPMR
jgi:hypothetical protein